MISICYVGFASLDVFAMKLMIVPGMFVCLLGRNFSSY